MFQLISLLIGYIKRRSAVRCHPYSPITVEMRRYYEQLFYAMKVEPKGYTAAWSKPRL